MTIHISVTGPRGSGKTTASRAISQALREAGFTDFAVDDVHGDNTHKPLPVSGYRKQDQVSVDLVNQNKETEEKILRLIDSLRNSQTPDGQSFIVDPRWLAEAKTDLEKGFMCLNRAIFQPERISLPGDEA